MQTKGERIKELRELAGINQVDLANSVGVSKQNMYKYENGKITNIPMDKIELIAKELSVSPAYIMGWQENKTNDLTDSKPKEDETSLSLTKKEKLLIELWNNLDSDLARAKVINFLKTSIEMNKEDINVGRSVRDNRFHKTDSGQCC